MITQVTSKTWETKAYTTSNDEWPYAVGMSFATQPEKVDANGNGSSWSGDTIKFRDLKQAKALRDCLDAMIKENS